MELIVFVLILIAAAVLFPEGTRAFVMFTLKATAAVAVIGCVLLIIGGLLGSRSSVPPVKKFLGPTYEPARVITLDDGTRLTTTGGWYTADGELFEADK